MGTTRLKRCQDQCGPHGGPYNKGTGKRPNIQKSKRRLVRIVTVALCAYVGVCVVVGFLQGRLIYFPSRGYAATPGTQRAVRPRGIEKASLISYYWGYGIEGGHPELGSDGG